jgi:hypothetical protein
MIMDNLNGLVSDETLEQEAIPSEENIAYNPVVEEDTENIEVDTSEIGIFKIDERMPVELQEQLRKFNEKTESLNNIISGMSSDISDSKNIDDTDYSDDGAFDDSTSSVDDQDESIQEDDSFEVGDIF